MLELKCSPHEWGVWKFEWVKAAVVAPLTLLVSGEWASRNFEVDLKSSSCSVRNYSKGEW